MAVGFLYTTDESKITELAGTTLSRYYADLDAMLQAQERANRVVVAELGIERRGFVLSRGHVLDAEVVGCRIRWPRDEEPMVEGPAVPEDAPVTELRVPDPAANPIVRRELAIAKAFYDKTGQKASISFNGPVTVAALAVGMTRFYSLAAGEPDAAEALVRRTTEAMIAWKRYHDSEMGIAPGGDLGLADDGASFLSPPDFRRLSLPWLRAWYAAFPGYAGRGLHICGNSTHLLDALGTLDLTSFDMGEMVDIPAARAAMPRTYLWRLADWRTVRDGTSSDIERSVRKDLDAGAPGGRFGIHVEGWRGVPLSKVRVVKECIDRHNATLG